MTGRMNHKSYRGKTCQNCGKRYVPTGARQYFCTPCGGGKDRRVPLKKRVDRIEESLRVLVNRVGALEVEVRR